MRTYPVEHVISLTIVFAAGHSVCLWQALITLTSRAGLLGLTILARNIKQFYLFFVKYIDLSIYNSIDKRGIETYIYEYMPIDYKKYTFYNQLLKNVLTMF